MNFDLLTNEISDAARSALNEAVATLGTVPLAGFALYSDAGAMGVCPAFNTRTNFSRSVSTDPQDASYYRWSPGEWDLESFGIEHFERVNRSIRMFVATVPEEAFGEFRARFFNSCVVALRRVRQLSCFAEALDGCAVVFSVTDFDHPPSEKAWIADLNESQEAQEFCHWIDSLSH